MQPPKTEVEIEAMRQGGARLATILEDLKHYVQPGMSGREIDSWVAQQITKHGAEATYQSAEVNFPGVICISVNEQIVHGVPTDVPLEPGDVVSFDLVITYGGMKTDSAFTMVVGAAPQGAVKHLLQTTERSLYAGIDAVKGPVYTGDIAAAVEAVLTAGKLGIVRDLVGHGVGHEMHMPPDVPNYGRKGSGVLLRPGDTVAIEPMATLGGERIITEADGWTISTQTGSLAAHFEHTILVTNEGAQILTKR